MPLLHEEKFVTRLQKGNRIQLPVLIRWKYRLEQGEIFKVNTRNPEKYKNETFYARLGIDGRITIPKLILELIEAEAGTILEVTLYPEKSSEIA